MAIFTQYPILGYLFIFLARIMDVTLQTTRMILMVRGERLKAACIGFFEVIIYVTALNIIFDNLNNLGNLLAYALGFSSGNYIGGVVEELLAIGVQMVQVITMKEPLGLAARLREIGYGVTVLEGQGHTGPQFILQVLVSRKEVPRLSKAVDDWDKGHFMIITDAKKYHGGIMPKSRRAMEKYAKKGK
ncbi:MAG: DUF5698 domain-containing protein [Peptococcaceae bacterium]|jgi:uncharacterized protein YebE (UPF0316 family)|nr:DUF5698 domain-containing protein [Peptococcaceae bacterium]